MSGKGFTLIELLVTTTIVGILAGMSVALFDTYRDTARGGASLTEMASISTMIVSAQLEVEDSLLNITSSGCTGCSCRSGDQRKTTGGCYTDLNTSLQSVFAAANMTGEPPDSMLRDGWGSPYNLDENEGEGGNCIVPDVIISHGADGLYRTSDDIIRFIPVSGFCP